MNLCLFGLLGGETQADRTHVKREENITGSQLPFPRQTRLFVQGTAAIVSTVLSSHTAF